MRVSWSYELSAVSYELSVIRCEFQIIDIGAELRVEEKSRCALAVANGISLVDLPGRRLRFASRPCLTSRAYAAGRQILDAQLEGVPRVRFPRERNRDGALRLRFPRLELEALRCSVQDQAVPLNRNSDVGLHPSPRGRADIGLHGVVGPLNGADEHARSLE